LPGTSGADDLFDSAGFSQGQGEGSTDQANAKDGDLAKQWRRHACSR